MKKVFILVLFFTPIALFAQNSISIQTQVYPAGIMSSIRLDYNLGNSSFLTSRVGYNFTDRQDFGKNDNEEGGGLGFGLGFARSDFFTPNLTLHAKTDLWFMDIDWRNTQRICGIVPPCGDVTFTGTTEITVLQPALGMEYNFNLSENLFLKPSLSFGYEINIKTKGRDVGEGAILLVGFSFGHEF